MEDRGTGITTKQILEAPANSIYVWCNERLDYPKRLSCELGRQDLRIAGPSILDPHRLNGLARELVLDHALDMTEKQLIGFNTYITRRGLLR